MNPAYPDSKYQEVGILSLSACSASARKRRTCHWGTILVLCALTVLAAPDAEADVWTAAGLVQTPRRTRSLEGHALAALGDERVLMMGGGEPAEKEAQLWDSRVNRWSIIQPMQQARSHHSAITLADGRILVVGGWTERSRVLPGASAELWDPRTGQWQATGAMSRGRTRPSLFLLPNSTVLAIGGEAPANECRCTTEIWEPRTGQWSTRAELPGRCGRLAAAPLGRDRFLVTGGSRATTNGGRQIVAEANVFEPGPNRWAAGPTMLTPREGHEAAAVGGGVLVMGGVPRSTPEAQAGELLDSQGGTWRWIRASAIPDRDLLLLALYNGDALIASGLMRGTVERWDSKRGVLTPAAETFVSVRKAPRAARLPDGRVLLTVPPSPLAMIWDAAGRVAGSWANWSGPARVPFWGTATRLPNDQVLLAGGESGAASQTAVRLGDLRVGSWRAVQPLSIPRSNHTATALPDGQVLVVGGMNLAAREKPGSRPLVSAGVTRPSQAYLDSAERWNADRGWMSAGQLATPRAHHTATLLHDGRVLVVGGLYHDFGPSARVDGRLDFSGPKVATTVELGSPATGRWELTGQLRRPRTGHTATLLPDGRVLVAGGNGASSFVTEADAWAELWDPKTGIWQPAGRLEMARYDHSATLLPDGRVLVVGGHQTDGGIGAVGTSELWDPKTMAWTNSGPLNIPRFAHRALASSSGQVLISGGSPDGNGLIRHGELWSPQTGRWVPTPPLAKPASSVGLVKFIDDRALLILPDAALLFSF